MNLEAKVVRLYPTGHGEHDYPDNNGKRRISPEQWLFWCFLILLVTILMRMVIVSIFITTILVLIVLVQNRIESNKKTTNIE